MSRDRRGGERCQPADSKPHAIGTRTRLAPRLLRRHVLRSVHGPVHVDRLPSCRRKSVGMARSQGHRGRANPSHREEPAPGSLRSDALRGSPPVTVSPREWKASVTGQTRKTVSAVVPARNEEPTAHGPYVVSSCRSRQAWPGLEYAPAQRSKKSGGGSERGPSPAQRSADTSDLASRETETMRRRCRSRE